MSSLDELTGPALPGRTPRRDANLLAACITGLRTQTLDDVCDYKSAVALGAAKNEKLSDIPNLIAAVVARMNSAGPGQFLEHNLWPFRGRSMPSNKAGGVSEAQPTSNPLPLDVVPDKIPFDVPYGLPISPRPSRGGDSRRRGRS